MRCSAARGSRRGRAADITVMDIDPLVIGATRPEDLLKGRIRLTMVAGRIVHEAPSEGGCQGAAWV